MTVLLLAALLAQAPQAQNTTPRPGFRAATDLPAELRNVPWKRQQARTVDHGSPKQLA